MTSVRFRVNFLAHHGCPSKKGKDMCSRRIWQSIFYRCKLMIIRGALLLSVGCQRQEKDATIDDLNSIKKDFLLSIVQEDVEESPFHVNYSLRTVFFSKDVVSLFGEVHVYEHLPHPWTRYEGKTLFKIHGKFQEVKFGNLFPTPRQKEFLRKYCEDDLKTQSVSYFSGINPLHTTLKQEDICLFVLDDKFLIILFQSYTVGGLSDGPLHVKVPYETLKKECVSSYLLQSLISKISSSTDYTSSWDY